MGIFRLFRGELRKIFLKPGIFIMAGLLILVLAISPKFFTPNNKTDISSHKFSGNTVSEVFLDFREKELTEQGPKFVYADLEENAATINELLTLAKSPKSELQSAFFETQNARESFSGKIQVHDVSDSDLPELKAAVQKIYDYAVQTKTLFLDYLKRDLPLILVTEEEESNITFALNNLITKLDLYVGKDKSIDDYKDLETYIETNEIITVLKKNIGTIDDLKYKKQTLQDLYDDYYSTTSVTLTTLYNQMTEMVATSGSSSDAKDIVKLTNHAYKYLGVADNATNILKYGVMNAISQTVSDKTLSSYQGEIFENFNSYKVEESLSKYTYLYDNNKSDKDFANVLAFNQGSNTKTNAYDYMYFVMEIMSFVIIAYCVVLGANMIASEQSSGTMKMIAIRPYKRWKIMFSKILATLFFAFIFMTVTAVVSLITGLIIYNLDSLPILAVFNAKYVFPIAAPLMYLIYFGCVFIKIWLFVMIAFAISTIFKNGIISTTISILLYFVTMIVTFVASGANWIKYIITANFDLFKYFGGSFLINPANNTALTNLFISPVFTDTNVLFGGIIVGVLMLGLHLLTYLFFTKRDIN